MICIDSTSEDGQEDVEGVVEVRDEDRPEERREDVGA